MAQPSTTGMELPCAPAASAAPGQEVSTFTYVCVPADDSRPIEEGTHTGLCELGKCVFIDSLKEKFVQASAGASLDAEKWKAAMSQSAGKDVTKDVNPETLDRLAQMLTVEVFTALSPVKENDWEQISVYVDDKGVGKNLPVNKRLTQLMHHCGYTNQQFLGDAFIGRVFDDQEDIWKRASFGQADLSSDAPWTKMVQKQQSNRANPQAVEDFKKLAAGSQGQSHEVQMAMAQKAAQAQGARPAGSTEMYEWADREDDEVEIRFTSPVKSKKDVKVKIQKQHLTVEIAGKVAMDGKLHGRVDPESCCWSLSNGEVLEVTLIKQDPERWPMLLA